MHTVGAEFVRDVAPGEIIRIDKSGVHSSIGATLPPQKKVRHPHHLQGRACVRACVCVRSRVVTNLADRPRCACSSTYTSRVRIRCSMAVGSWCTA